MNADPTEFCEEAGERAGPFTPPTGEHRPDEGRRLRRGLHDGRGWRTPRRSDPNAHGCVEARPAAAGVRVRDSRNRDGAELGFGDGDWCAFLALLRRGASVD
ncbi:DUF397 domain-containing protein [Nocardiopsis potens]|uniref:DUF397 domain-containing protein n=1 Tax=Nocardiopsis potens TaxID=1246458 RepID=UPI001378DD90|nr:DUF397 domain-containing protein [Nocardiopsis potens]